MYTFYVFLHSLIQQIFFEHLLCFRHWEYDEHLHRAYIVSWNRWKPIKQSHSWWELGECDGCKIIPCGWFLWGNPGFSTSLKSSDFSQGSDLWPGIWKLALWTSSSSLGYTRNHEGAMSFWAMAEWWSWAHVLTTDASHWPFFALLGHSCLFLNTLHRKILSNWSLAEAQEKWQ